MMLMHVLTGSSESPVLVMLCVLMMSPFVGEQNENRKH